MGGVITAIRNVFAYVAGCFINFFQVIKTVVEPPAEKCVEGARSVIENANKPEQTGQYITAKTEQKELDKVADKFGSQLDKKDKNVADEYLRSLQ